MCKWSLTCTIASSQSIDVESADDVFAIARAHRRARVDVCVVLGVGVVGILGDVIDEVIV